MSLVSVFPVMLVYVMSLSVLVSVVWTIDKKKCRNLSKNIKFFKLPVIRIVCIGISKIVIYLAIIYSSVGTSKTQHVSHLISMRFSLTKCNYVNLLRKNCSLYSDTAFGESSLSNEGIEAVRSTDKDNCFILSSPTLPMWQKSDFSSADYEQKERWREGDKWKGGRHSVSLNVVIEAGFRALSDNRIRLQRRVRCLQFRPLLPSGPHTEVPYNYFKHPLMRGKKQHLDSLTSLPSSFPPVIECRHKPEDKRRENKKWSQLQKITSLCLNNGITFLSWIETPKKIKK